MLGQPKVLVPRIELQRVCRRSLPLNIGLSRSTFPACPARILKVCTSTILTPATIIPLQSTALISATAKIVVLGAQNVGKTSLLTRFIHNTFLPPSAQPPTIGATFLTKRITSADHPSLCSPITSEPSFAIDESGPTVRLQIWDTAGQERFRSLGKLYYRGAHAAILCYDVTNERSFMEMGTWLRELREYNNTCAGGGDGGDGCVVHVVGTKADIVAEDPERREVPFERCIAYVAEQLHGGGSGSAAARSPTSNQPPSLCSTISNTSATRAPSPSPTSTLAAFQSCTTVTTNSTAPAPPPPTSNRNSGFWSLASAQPTTHAAPPATASSTTSTETEHNTAWDSCHEISAKDGEGVEEVFRVIVRKLVEQKQRRAARLATHLALTGARTPSCGSGFGAYSDKIGDDGLGVGNGSFRLTRNDKRKSWLLGHFPAAGVGIDGVEQSAMEGKRGGRCC